MRTVLLALLVLLAVPVVAQDASPAPFTEIEALRVQNLNLRGALLQRELADYQRDLAALKVQIEEKRPGWTWDAETGKFTKHDPPVK